MVGDINTDKFGMFEDKEPHYPGHQLQQARESKGLSQDQVAQSLRLTKTVIEALESGHFSASKGQVFDRGYIRAYARYLNISSDELLKGYSMLMGSGNYSMTPNVLEVKSAVPKNQFKDPWIIGVTVVVIITLLSVLAWWWNTQNTPIETAQVETVTVQDSQGIDQVEILSNPVEPVYETSDETTQALNKSATAVGTWVELDSLSTNSENDVSLVLEADTDTQNTNVDDVSTSADALDATDTALWAVQEDNVSESSTVIDANTGLDLSSNRVDSTLANLVNEDSSTNETAALSDTSTLRIVFSKDCWVEIIDRDGQKALVGLFSAGRTVEVPVTAPAQVLLGRSSGIEEFNYGGRDIDLEPFTRKDIARFTLEL